MTDFIYIDTLLDDVNGADRVGDLLAVDPRLVHVLNEVLIARGKTF